MVASATRVTEQSEGGTIESLLLDLNLGQENAGQLAFRVKLIHSTILLGFDIALATLH